MTINSSPFFKPHKGGEASPHSKEVADFHINSDKDSSPLALHHTLGRGALQAAPGNLSYSKAETDAKYSLASASFTSAPLNTNINGAVDMYRNGRVVSVVFNLSCAFAQPAGTVYTTFPVGWRPFYVNVGTYYFTGVRQSSGMSESMYFDSNGRIVNVFNIPAGDGVLGTFTFVVYN